MIKNILFSKKSKDVKNLFENFAALTILQVIGYIFPLITLPYLAKVIGVTKFGMLAYANVIVSYVATLVYFGFQFTAVRDISRNRNDQEKLNEIVSIVIYTMILLLIISLLILSILVFGFSNFIEYRILLFLYLLNIPAQIINFDWFFQGIEKMKYFTILSFISKLIYTISIFIIIKNEKDYVLIPLMLSISTFISGTYALFIVFVKYQIKIKFPGFNVILNTIATGWSVFVSQLAPNLYNSFSTIVLKGFYGDSSVGIYDAGRRVISISEQMSMIFSKATFPYLSRRIERHELFMKINLILSIGLTIFNLIFAELMVNILYTPEFKPATWVIRILALTPLAFSLINGYGINYLLQIGEERKFRNIVLFCSILGFILLFILVPRFSFYGASVTVVFIFLLQGIICQYHAIKHRRNCKHTKSDFL